jgi:hypothetical protein
MYYKTKSKDSEKCVKCKRPLIHWEQIDVLLIDAVKELLYEAGMAKYEKLHDLGFSITGKMWEAIENDNCFDDYVSDIPIPEYFYIECESNTPILRPAKIHEDTKEVECASCLEAMTTTLK